MNGTPNQGRRGPRFAAALRPALLWVLAFATALMVFQAIQGREKRAEITYSDLTRELARENIAAVEIVAEERKLTGEFRSSVRIAGRDVREFRANLPFEDPAPLVTRLEQGGVPIRAAKAGPSWLSILLSAIPWLLIGGFWLMITRQMRLGGQRALSFGRMGARPVAGEQSKVTFADVAGEQSKVTFADVAGADEAKAGTPLPPRAPAAEQLRVEPARAA